MTEIIILIFACVVAAFAILTAVILAARDNDRHTGRHRR